MSASSQFVEFSSSFPLHEIMESVAIQMQANFDGISSQIKHKPSKGSAREEILRRFLSNYLPESVEIGKGEIVDVHGNRSDQTDLVIFDRLNCPKLIQVGDNRIYPVEGVLASIEVKSKLNKATLKESVENILAAKRLQKTAFYKGGNIINTWNLYGRKFEYFPMMGYVFAFQSIRLQSIVQYLDEINLEHNIPPEHQIDVICLMDKGIIAHENNEGQLISWSEPTNVETGETTIVGLSTKHSLLLFYVMLHDQLSITSSRPIQMVRYIPSFLRFGSDEDEL